ncbi:MAG: pyridoxal-phosphate dependent enzyme [Steroidobacteraceae bacterium]|nr:pyridoxal-phosphate dependent enzyme [Steroidobacteraceae bacterium]
MSAGAVHPSPESDLPGFGDVVAALGRLSPRLVRTPVASAPGFDALCDRRVYLKCENLQHGGAFKYRGALNALLLRPACASHQPVATHSSGNHGTALALAARALGLHCHVVIPQDASAAKLAALQAAGASVRRCAPGLAAREAALADWLAESPAHLVHPFDDARVIAGQGTAALELLCERPDLDVVAVPVGGGGLLGGTALAARGAKPGCRVVGVEPALADDTWRSFASGRREGVAGSPATIADGLRGSIGARNFELLLRHVDEVLVVSERSIVAAMRLVLEHFRMLVEPSSAVPIAALLEGRLGRPGERVGVVVSGGNVDLAGCPFLAGERLAATAPAPGGARAATGRGA